MQELLVVLGVIVLVGGLAALAMLPVNTLLWIAGGVFSVGFIVGVGAGITYHVRLYQVLTPRGELSSGWLWKPYRDHEKLQEHERFGVLLWWYLGGIGFLGVVLGGLAGGVAVVRVFLENAAAG